MRLVCRPAANGAVTWQITVIGLLAGKMELQDKVRRFGYLLFEQEGEQDSVYHRLEIALKRDPDQSYSKIMEVKLRVVSKARREGDLVDVSRLVISSRWPDAVSYKVIPGKIVLNRKGGDQIEFYTFGGGLKIHGNKQVTFCSLRSPAPIYLLEGRETPTELLVEEIEGLLAMEHARWGEDDQGYLSELAEIPPEVLFVACLESLSEKYEQMGNVRDRQTQELIQYLNDKINKVEMKKRDSLSSLLSRTGSRRE